MSGLARRALSRPLVRAAVALAAATVLTACGGGDPLENFQARRVLAFGDENSVIDSTGRKYTIDALKSDNVTIDCAANPIWIQTVASSFGLVFPQCNPNNVAAPLSRILAAPGAKVADVKTQVDAHLASDTFGSKDLATILAGRNDLIEIYRRFPAISADQARTEAAAAGAVVAAQVNRIANAGGRVLISEVVDLGQTPFALAEKAANPGVDRAELLTSLVTAFNTRLRVDIINDGRKIGLVQSDERVREAVAFPGNFGLVNVTQAACASTVTVLDCNTRTLVTGSTGTPATASTWLWADSVNLSPAGHFRIGEAAAAVANNNPF